MALSLPVDRGKKVFQLGLEVFGSAKEGKKNLTDYISF